MKNSPSAHFDEAGANLRNLRPQPAGREHAEQVAELFKAVIDLGSQARQSLLDERCRSNPELRAEVESLLAMQAQAESFLEKPAMELAAKDFACNGAFAAGDAVDHYEIVSLIGKGGMGEVYLAQDRRVRRKVALKLVRGGLDREVLTRRFQREQELLAGLNHPNIAQLFETGVTPDGTPYFAMEYVDGVRLDCFAEDRALKLRERLDLFQKICAAVAYAHQHLVVHRDIKPANILVTAQGEPKLLDFGIAKLLDELANNEAEQTLTMERRLTPEYASPEQIRGERIITASDIYSLGVVLYELLTGAKPYRLTSRRPDELTRAITEQEPVRPSSLPECKRRPPRGDLDNIVLMALRKEPERRYPSAGALSEDIRRYLVGLPVRARKDTLGYRASKFIRRHRWELGAATLIVVAIVAGLIATLIQARRAEEHRARAEARFDDVRQLANSLLFEVMPRFVQVPGTDEAREIAVQRALEYLDRLSAEAGTDPTLQKDLAAAYRALAEQIDASSSDVKRNLEVRRKGMAAIEAFVQGRPHDLRARDELTRHYAGYGWTLWSNGDSQGALEFYGKTLALRKALVQEDPQTFDFRSRLAHVELCLGDLFYRNGPANEAISHYREAARILETLHPDEPANRLKVQRNLVYAHNGIGDALRLAGDPNGALQEYAQARAIIEPVAAAAPDNLVNFDNLRRSYQGEAEAHRMLRNYPQALERLERCREFDERIMQTDPRGAPSLAGTYSDLGNLLSEMNDLAQASEYLRRALSIQEKRVADGANRHVDFASLALTYERTGALAEKLGRKDDALANYERALPLHQRLASDPLNTPAQKAFTACRGQIEKLQRARLE